MDTIYDFCVLDKKGNKVTFRSIRAMCSWW